MTQQGERQRNQNFCDNGVTFFIQKLLQQGKVTQSVYHNAHDGPKN